MDDDPRLLTVLARWRDDDPGTWVLWPTSVRALPPGMRIEPGDWVGYLRHRVRSVFGRRCQVLGGDGRAVSERRRLDDRGRAQTMWLWHRMTVGEACRRFAERYRLTLAVLDEDHRPTRDDACLGLLATLPDSPEDSRRELGLRLSFARSPAELCDLAGSVVTHLGDVNWASEILDGAEETAEQVDDLARIARLSLELGDLARNARLEHEVDRAREAELLRRQEEERRLLAGVECF